MSRVTCPWIFPRRHLSTFSDPSSPTWLAPLLPLLALWPQCLPPQTRSTPTPPPSPGRTTSGRTLLTLLPLSSTLTSDRGSRSTLLPPTIACSYRQSILCGITISTTLAALLFPPSTQTTPSGSQSPTQPTALLPLALLTTIPPLSTRTSSHLLLRTRRTSFARGQTLVYLLPPPTTPTPPTQTRPPPQTLLSLLPSISLPPSLRLLSPVHSTPMATCPPPTPGLLLLPISPVPAQIHSLTAIRPQNLMSSSIPGLFLSILTPIRFLTERNTLPPPLRHLRFPLPLQQWPIGPKGSGGSCQNR